MNPFLSVRPRIVASAILLLAAYAASPQNPTDCAAVKFSDELLERFPQARESCLDVISRGGQEYAVFNARLTQVSGNNVRVRFRHPDGSLGPSTRITAPPDFRVLVNGEPTRVRDLAPNQDLKTYVQVSRPMVAFEPADSSQQLHVVPLVIVPASAAGDERTRLAQADEELSMPATAGPTPILAALGLFFACAALGARALRGIQTRRRRRDARLAAA